MKKSLLNLGTVLNKTEQKAILGGDNDVFDHEGGCWVVDGRIVCHDSPN